MQLKAFWRSLIAAGAIAIFFGGTAQAQTSRAATQAEAGKPLALGKYVKHRSRHAKKTATRHSRHTSKKTAKKSSVSRKSTERTAATKKDTKDSAKADSAKTASVRKAAEELSAVANARAELNTGDQQAADMAAAFKFYTPSRPENANASGTQISASDELNDLDKAAHAASAISAAASAPVVATATTAAAAPVAAPVSDQLASSRDDAGDTWGKTSLIGKIFVAFGGLLTLASAARMFMA
jgi:hypothetical protein